MIWITYALLAAALWAIVNVVDKFTMAKLVDSPLIPMFIMSIVGLLMSGVIYCANGLTIFSSIDLVLGLFAGLSYALTMLFYYLALKYEEVSKVIPVYYLTPVFILIIAKEFLDENLSDYQYIGIAFLVLGAIFISIRLPLRLGLSKGIGYIILAALFYAFNQVLTKYLLKYNGFWDVFAYIRISIFLSLLPVFFWRFNHFIPYCKKLPVRTYGVLIVNQVLNIMGVFCITMAMTSGYVTLVNALASVQPFFVLMFTIMLGFFVPHILEETLKGWALIQKLIATSFIFIGILMIS